MITKSNQSQNLKHIARSKDSRSLAHHQLHQVPTTKSKAKDLIVVSKTSVLSNLSKENKVLTTMIKIPLGKTKPFKLNQETQVLSIKITLV